jgi:hypothetical protein
MGPSGFFCNRFVLSQSFSEACELRGVLTPPRSTLRTGEDARRSTNTCNT